MLKKLLNRMQTEQGRKNIKFALAKKIFNPLLRNIGYTLITEFKWIYQGLGDQGYLRLFAALDGNLLVTLHGTQY
ncbi:hypothetical protein [Microcystis aeruginosa]|uniref:Transposase n=1 Tax=Microcystis aeruginosa PCC 9808 TaxID=1160284 RepID=I4HGW6_MICAE|nr:hypothetical protein [Microcystis aeruginosa]CCI21290.1 transposase [Microcystis aeruginosa PCC 9808]